MRGEDASVVGILQRAASDLRELKTRQLFGADNLVTTGNVSGNTYDKSVTIPGHSYGTMTVTFDATNQDYAFTAPTFYIYEDGLTPAHYILAASNDSSPINIGGTTAAVQELVSSSGTPKRTQWQVRILNGGASSHTYYLIAVVWSTDTGAIS